MRRMTLPALVVLVLAAGGLAFFNDGRASASPSATISQTWEKNDCRSNRGCGGLDADAAYANDSQDATEHDENVNGQDGTDRYIGRQVVKDDGTVKMYVEVWCIDHSYYAVRVRQTGAEDRSWMT